MSGIKKTKISVLPYFELEAAITTFLNIDKFEYINLSCMNKGHTEKFAQNMFGNWCFPLKMVVAACEEAIIEKGVTKIISANVKVCSYPLVMGNLKRWIKKDFEYYAINVDKHIFPFKGVKHFYNIIKKIDPEIQLSEYMYYIPISIRRFFLAKDIRDFYYKNIPLVKNPKAYKRKFENFKQKFFNLKTIEESSKICEDFKFETQKLKIIDSPKYKFLVSGDLYILMLEFPLFDLESFLAKHNALIVKPFMPYSFIKYSKYAKQSNLIMSEMLSQDKNTKIDNHSIEKSTLCHILKGVEENVDGIIYIKPNMCTPCDNLSYILKEKNNFNLPMVEISYDEHSGTNGIITRLEAFLNIVSENKEIKD